MTAQKNVLTGGPGVGKSTIIELLGKDRWQSIYLIGEAATYIIERELAKEKRGEKAKLPWTDRDGFQREVLGTQLEWEESIPSYAKIAIQDRGRIDGLAYYHAEGLKAPRELEEAARNANYHKIFLLEPLERHERSTFRREEKEFAERLHKQIQVEYIKLGYELIPIPRGTPEERTRKILEQI